MQVVQNFEHPSPLLLARHGLRLNLVHHLATTTVSHCDDTALWRICKSCSKGQSYARADAPTCSL